MRVSKDRSFNKVLVANRGEIAVRVIRACRELGITTVAVYSELDRDALHVRLADEAHALGGQSAAESYLNTEAILAAITASGAEAVHPGYGFFSENADFARAITDRGVTFIGPPPEAIEVMGDKISARAAAARVGVTGVPGNTEFLTDPAAVVAFGEAHGWPVAIKAAFGGGGRGMKVVRSADEAPTLLESAQREATAYFGRGECYLERYLTKPRHIEVQVLCDGHGNGIYLGLRDCSAQRRHQKLVEEAPAPGLTPEIVKAMGEAAVTVALGCNYTNAGTVEFLYEDGQFFYLEMNTRLQVEHPVTEMVTGLDLVALQLAVAAGAHLPLTQDQVTLTGHAIEVRINAEDPAGGAFRPSPGQITKLRLPSGFGVRWDGGYEAGDTVSQYYDNLVGKLVCWGADRSIAIARTLRALGEMQIEGVATTIPADVAILSHPDFQAIEHSTKWVEEVLDLSAIGAKPPAAAPVGGDDDSEAPEPKARRDLDVEVNGKRFKVSMWVPESQSFGGGGGGGTKARKPTRRAASRSTVTGSGSGEVSVPMQGTVVKVLVTVGQEVQAGETVIVLEAMKMENNVVAERSGPVKEVRVASGQSVSGGDIVVVIG
jgi:acetyl-CoA/propionyl-CoA carboxylase, biotin carboxylase, biotin carboxyl carrier protein